MLAQIWAGTTSLQVALSHSCLAGFSQPVRAPTSSCKACQPFGSSSDLYNAEGTLLYPRCSQTHPYAAVQLVSAPAELRRRWMDLLALQLLFPGGPGMSSACTVPYWEAKHPDQHHLPQRKTSEGITEVGSCTGRNLSRQVHSPSHPVVPPAPESCSVPAELQQSILLLPALPVITWPSLLDLTLPDPALVSACS